MTRPRLLLIATGGTIASQAADEASTGLYRPASVSAQALLAAVPALSELAEIEVEQPFAIGSEHLTSRHWMQLASRVRTAQDRSDLTGIVVTHGTDTLEETALVLDLLCERRLPVVMTGAMRPASALSADGPMNLLAAIHTALDAGARQAGVMIVMNDRVLAPDRARKSHTSRVDAFDSREAQALADLHDARPQWHGPASSRAQARPSLAQALARLPEALPRVDLLATHVDLDPRLIDWLLAQGTRGLVLAGTGHGTFAEPVQQAVRKAVQAGCIVVRASRVPEGPVRLRAGLDDADLGTLAAGYCTPHKARTILSLALAAGACANEIQRLLLAL
jgi:L-asparaginase